MDLLSIPFVVVCLRLVTVTIEHLRVSCWFIKQYVQWAQTQRKSRKTRATSRVI